MYQCTNQDIKNMSMSEFADCVAWDLIYNEEKKDAPSTFITTSGSPSTSSSIGSKYPGVNCISIESPLSSMSTITNLFDEVEGHQLKRTEERENGRTRHSINEQ